MNHILRDFTDSMKKSNTDRVNETMNQYQTYDSINELTISGFRGMHAHQVYKRKPLLENYKRIALGLSGFNVGP